MAVGQGGYNTNNMPIGDGSDVSGAALTAYDTQADNGASPQTIAIPIGTVPAVGGLTAQADGTKANATVLDYGISGIATVAGAADSVLLPPALPGSVCYVVNKVATAIQVFGQGTDTIQGVATATGNVQAASKTAIYTCDVAGLWWQMVGA